jgi:hypothetical protein
MLGIVSSFLAFFFWRGGNNCAGHIIAQQQTVEAKQRR